jgi:hypothetical protein
MPQDQVAEQLECIRGFEVELGVPLGFFEKLLHEDDWSFLIKLHALVEAASTNVLTEALNRPELRDQLARTPLSDSESGKLPMMKSLGIVSTPYRGFIRKLSELRNRAVHNVEHTSMSLKSMVVDASKEKRVALADALGVGVRSIETRRELLAENPRGLIWISALCLISMLALHKVRLVSNNKIKELGAEALALVENNVSGA